MEEDALRLFDELVPPSDMRSTSRSPATPVNERDCTYERKFESGYNISVRWYHFSWAIPAPAAVGPHATPDAADGDSEADMDTSVPTHHDPTPYILDRPRFASPQTRIQIPLAQLLTSASRRTAVCSARPTRASPPSLPLPPFPMAPTPSRHSNLRSPPHSRVLAPLRPPPLLHVYKRPRTTRRRLVSSLTISISTAPTISPARYATEQALARANATSPPRGPKLFFTLAKTGAGVSDVFAYIAQRVLTRWETRAEPPNGVRKGSTVLIKL
ncbi:hypothetical protein BGW80DRAFT_1469556 [Lactifluus volemus]|nr:hypothetical protein BGW80DRAFT_1469556 [Lactifluus volemus]